MSKPDLPARRRLRVAQQAFRSGEGLANAGHSDADRIATVVQLDFAVETVLRAVLFDAGHSKARADRFKDLLDAVRDELKARRLADNVPSRGGIEQLRGVRNAAQHEARVPITVEVIECVVHARDSLVELVRVVWDADFFAADVDAVQSERVREYLQRALDAQAESDLYRAMGWVRAAFEHAYTYAGQNLVGRRVDFHDMYISTRYGQAKSLRGSDLEVALSRLQVIGRLSAFGISLPQYLYWLEKLSKAPSLNIKDELIEYEKDFRDWTQQDFDAALGYVVECVLKMEEVVPDLDSSYYHRGKYELF